MDANKAVLDLCGVSAWHDRGITGKLGMAGTTERFDETLIPGSVCLTPDQKPTQHAYQTARTFRVVAPDAKMVMLDTCKTTNYANGKPVYSGALVEKTIPYMLAHQVCVVTKSESQTKAKDDIEPYAQLMDTCALFASAGNLGDGGHNALIDSEYWFGVGALRYRNGKVTTEYYTSESEYVDFAGFTYIVIPTESGKTVYDRLAGTSFGCPWTAAAAFLINQIALEKTGFPLTAAQMYAYLKAHAVDADAAGKDVRTGYGYIKLPKPDVAERELFHLLKIADRLYAEAKAVGKLRTDAAFYLDMAKDWKVA